MRTAWFFGVAAAIAFAGAAPAQRGGEAGRDWRLLGFSHDGGAAEFIDANSIVTASDGTAFDVATDYRERQRTERGSWDREVLSYSVDCATRSYRKLNHVYSTGGRSGPPAILRVLTVPAPPEGSLLDVQIRSACGQRPLSAQTYRNPSDIWPRQSR